MTDTQRTNAYDTADLVEIPYHGETRLVYPEIAEFIKALDEAQRDHQREMAKIHREYAEAEYTKRMDWLSNPANDPRGWDSYSALGADRQAHRRAQSAAEAKLTDLTSARAYLPRYRHNADNRNLWQELHNKSTHPVVRWIVENCRDYESEALIILQHLPASIDRLWEVAKEDNDMCSVFDDFMIQAKAAGVLEGLDVHVPVSTKERMALRSYIRRTYGSGYTRDLMPRIDRIVKTELDAAKAEWQKLDEAYAENVRHNRSEGARRAAETRRRNREAAESAQADVVSLIKETSKDETHATA